MPLQATSGAASYDAFGGGVPIIPNYIEEVFSTWLYTGNGSSQTITNGVDLSGEGGMVWIKQRSATRDNLLFDTTRGATQRLFSNLTLAQSADTQSLTSFNSDGFSVGSDSGANINAGTYVSWTFRKQPKFFDVVTYTGNGSSPRNITHTLQSAPGCILIKATNQTGNWFVWHRNNGVAMQAFSALSLNTTQRAVEGAVFEQQTSTTFNPAAIVDSTAEVAANQSGVTYVAYLFAHNAGGFGLSGTDNVISCGSFTQDGVSKTTVNLGYEPQWLMFKRTDSATLGQWWMVDNMRGFSTAPTYSSFLWAQGANAEGVNGLVASPTATGFEVDLTGPASYIYIAIRRGPMKVPESGTSVYATDTFGGSSGGTAVPAYRAPFPVDFAFEKRTNAADNWVVNDRLRGINSLNFNLTAAEALYDAQYKMDFMNGWVNYTGSNSQYRSWMMRRAPGFFDEVCYTGNSTANRVLNHNLGVPPELIITKGRSGVTNWNTVYGITASNQNGIVLNTNGAGFGPFPYTPGNWILNAAPTATTITIGSEAAWNNSGATYVAYLFATCPGVSKVGSYTGTGTTQTINCGFTGGARFVLIKRTDSTGDWYVWDSARGIVAGNDPYLLLNSTAAEVTSTDYVDTYSAGFEITSTAPAAINASGGTFIFLAIA